MQHSRGLANTTLIAFVLGSALFWCSAAAAGPRGQSGVEPKRSYGSIDVILYQTSW